MVNVKWWVPTIIGRAYSNPQILASSNPHKLGAQRSQKTDIVVHNSDENFQTV